MGTAILTAVVLAIVSAGAAWLAVRARKTAGVIKNLPKIDIDEAKAGDVGKFVGTLGGDKIDVPYYDKPVVYYSFKLTKEVRTKDSQGRTKRTYKPMNDRDSDKVFELRGDKKALKIDPKKIGVSTDELYVGKAVGLSKKGREAMKFLVGATLRFDLGTLMRLNLRGLPYGKRVVGVGKVVESGGDLALVRDGGTGNIYTSDDPGAASKKESRNSIIFWIISGVSLVAAVVALFTIRSS